MNAMDLLGALMKSGMSRSGGHRIEHSMGSGGMGSPGSILGQVLGGGGIAVPNQQAAMQIYAASLLAIEVDTDQERRYLRDLATALGLDSNAVTYLHGVLGVAPLH